jgi:hypothetical protein
MADKKMTVDELFAEQSKSMSQLTATIEPVENTSNVKVTPWTPNGGCHCHLAIEISKTDLSGVTPTGDVHVCCGKTLKVVELHFKDDQTIRLADVFAQFAKNLSEKHEQHAMPEVPAHLPHHGGFPVPRSRRFASSGGPLGASPQYSWNEFWCDAEWFICYQLCQNATYRGYCQCLCDNRARTCKGLPEQFCDPVNPGW